MKNLKSLLFACLFSITTFSVSAQIAPVSESGLAIGGYDVVAYFSGGAKKGSPSIATKHNGATYYFATKDNLKAFKKSPASYLPQFDGYCAWGVAAKDSKFPINPETFDIIDGKLYLFFNGPFNGQPFNTLQPWSAETTKLRAAAHQKWSSVNSSN